MLLSQIRVLLEQTEGVVESTVTGSAVINAELNRLSWVDILILLPVTGTIVMIADSLADFTRAVGLEIDVVRGRLGLRSQRYAMVIQDGVVEDLLLEENGLSVANSAATCVLDRL